MSRNLPINSSSSSSDEDDQMRLLLVQQATTNKQDVYINVVKFLSNIKSAKIWITLILFSEALSKLLVLIKSNLFTNVQSDEAIFGIYCMYIAVGYFIILIIEKIVECTCHDKKQQQQNTNAMINNNSNHKRAIINKTGLTSVKSGLK